MSVTLVKTTVLLERDESADSAFGGYVSFSAPGSGVGVVWLGADVWVDMGQPAEVTVSVVPGDTMNGGPE